MTIFLVVLLALAIVLALGMWVVLLLCNILIK